MVENRMIQSAGMTHQEKMRRIGESYKVAYNFADKVFKKFPGIIKTIVLFGSVAKATLTKASDIDVLVVVDDTTLTPSRRFIDWYNTEVIGIVQQIDPRIHLTTVTLTTFWENIKVGEPVAINILRYGISLIDTGFFEPLQMLLKQGRIRPTEEAIENALMRVPGHMIRAKGRMLAAVIDYYWAMIDSAHAALMKHDQVPPSPEYVEKLLETTFVNKGLLNKKYVSYFHELWQTSKAIVHGELTRIGGSDYDGYQRMAEEFENEMKKLIQKKK